MADTELDFPEEVKNENQCVVRDPNYLKIQGMILSSYIFMYIVIIGIIWWNCSVLESKYNQEILNNIFWININTYGVFTFICVLFIMVTMLGSCDICIPTSSLYKIGVLAQTSNAYLTGLFVAAVLLQFSTLSYLSQYVTVNTNITEI